MTDFYAKLVEKSGFNEALVRRALDFAKTIDIDKFSRLFFDAEHYSVSKTGVLFYENAFYPYEFFDALKELPLSFETSSLYIYVAMLERSFVDFSSRIVDENIFFDTVKRLSAEAEYSPLNNEFSLMDYRFLSNCVRTNMLKLCTFEYQSSTFNTKPCTFLHIQNGADLSKSKKMTSYRLAREYFGANPIVADSWLLYPENKIMLPKNSNIVDFMNDFDIVATYETTDYSELFHVFGRLSDYSYENLPKETSLQRAYAERVRNHQPIGSAIGILKY